MTDIQKQFTFKIIGLELMDVNFKHPRIPDLKFDNFHFNIKMEGGAETQKKQVFNLVTVDTMTEDTKTLLASITVNIVYEIINFDDIITIVKGKADIPDYVVHILNGISYSTVRGIMFSEFKGTFLHTVVLPIIDPKQFLPLKK